jgi:uncharacterized protein
MTCPTCGRPIDPATPEKYLPFCTERCQWVDLGRWFGEEYTVPAADEDGGNGDDGERDGNAGA